jgi:putative ABC transport system substrate-binding protein
LVNNLGRPGGNLTGWTTLGAQMGPKQLELMREIVPSGSVVGLLVNPTNPLLAKPMATDVPPAARALGFDPRVIEASTEAGIEAAFATLATAGAKALVIGADTFFNSRNEQVVALCMRHRIASVSAYREHAAAGGLMSYGGSIAEASRQVGIYAGRILSGEKPSDLPVQEVTKLDLVMNLKTAGALGLKLPAFLLARADEVIE